MGRVWGGGEGGGCEGSEGTVRAEVRVMVVVATMVVVDGDGGGGDGDGTAPRCDLPVSLRIFHELPDEQEQVV
jgi:hypothetical protein